MFLRLTSRYRSRNSFTKIIVAQGLLLTGLSEKAAGVSLTCSVLLQGMAQDTVGNVLLLITKYFTEFIEYYSNFLSS